MEAFLDEHGTAEDVLTGVSNRLEELEDELERLREDVETLTGWRENLAQVFEP